MSEARRRSPILTFAIVGCAVLVSIALFLGFFQYLDSIGIRTGWIAFAITIVGLITLTQSNRHTFTGGLLMVIIGLILFANSLGYVGAGEAKWLWPLLLISFSLLILIFRFSQPSHTQ